LPFSINENFSNTNSSKELQRKVLRMIEKIEINKKSNLPREMHATGRGSEGRLASSK
jgi:hypothetical protein